MIIKAKKEKKGPFTVMHIEVPMTHIAVPYEDFDYFAGRIGKRNALIRIINQEINLSDIQLNDTI